MENHVFKHQFPKCEERRFTDCLYLTFEANSYSVIYLDNNDEVKDLGQKFIIEAFELYCRDEAISRAVELSKMSRGDILKLPMVRIS